MSNIVSNRVCFFDNDNFVVVTKNCSKEQATKIMQALAAVDLGVAPVEDGNLVPVPEPEETMPVIPDDEPVVAEEEVRFPNGKYLGKTPKEVLEEDGDKGYGNMAWILAKNKYKNMHTAIRAAMDEYYQERFKKYRDDPYMDVNDLSINDCREFFTYFGSILTDEQKDAIRSQSGMISFDAFVKDGTLEQLRSAIATIWYYTLRKQESSDTEN